MGATFVRRWRAPGREPEERAAAGPGRTAPASSATASGEWGIALAVAALALALRLRRVGHTNLWLDEIVSVTLARKPLPRLLAEVSDSPHGPLYYVLLKWWIALFGTTEGAVRALSAVAGAAVVLAVFRLGARLAGSEPAARRRLATVAALLTAASPVQLYYSQEARFHMLSALLCLVALAGYLAWRARAVRALSGDAGAFDAATRARDLLGFALPTALALYAYPLAALLVAALWADAGLLLVGARRRGASSDGGGAGGAAWRAVAREWLLTQGAVAVACLPFALGHRAAAVASTQVWRSPLGARRAVDQLLFYPVQQFQSTFLWWAEFRDAWKAFGWRMPWHYSPQDFLYAVSLPVACVAVALCLLAAARRSWRTPWRPVWLAAVVPLTVVAAVSARQSLDLSRYALFAAPPVLLLVARGLLALPRALTGAAWAVLLATSALGAGEYWRADVRDSDYRKVAALLARGARPDDRVIASPWYVSPAVSYYAPSLAFELRTKARYGWSSAVVPGGGVAPGPARALWWVMDYRDRDYFEAPLDSVLRAPALGGAPLRVVADTSLPSLIRVVELVPAGAAVRE